MNHPTPDTVGRFHHGPGRPSHVQHNVPVRAPWTEHWPCVVLGANGAKLRHRGDVQARSGEDVIEQNNRFDDGAALETVAQDVSQSSHGFA